jgi:SAM-dependent methyltransferase
MPTHQSLSGGSDEELLDRMIKTYPERFGGEFWALYTARVAPHLPPRPVTIDLGCGPGLFLRDFAARYPAARVFGYDVTPAMVTYARGLSFAAADAEFAVHDVTTNPLPHPAGSVDLVVMSSVLHVLDEPLPVLAEIRRVLRSSGIFLLIDWIRQPLERYLAWRRDTVGESETESRRRGFRLFPAQNKYTTEDWRWLLAEAGFSLRHQEPGRPSHRVFVTSRTPAD